MNYTKLAEQFICKMVAPLALAFVACSNGDDKSVAGGSAEETGVYALAGRVGDVVPRTLEASRRSAEVQKVVELSETQNSSRDSSVAKQAYMGTLFATKGTVVSIYELDSLTLEKTGRYYADTIDNDSGKFSFENIELASPYVLIETLDSCETADCSERGAWYMRPHFEIHVEYPCFKLDDGSESSGCKVPEKISKFPLQLSAIVDLRKLDVVSVNSLTDAKVPLLKKYIADGLSFDEAGRKAEQEILDFLGVYDELKNFEKVDDEESELAFVRELALIVAKSAYDVRFDLENGDIDLYFSPSGWYSGQGKEIEKVYRNAIKIIDYKLGFLARHNDLGRCTDSRENETAVVEGLHDSLSLVCRSGKWSLGFKSVQYTVGTMTDGRGGKTYKTVTYGFGGTTQTWMAENLNFAGATSTGVDSALKANLSGRTTCAAGDENCEVFGRNYEWIAAMNIANDDIKIFLERRVPGSKDDTTFLDRKCLDAEMEVIERCEREDENCSPFGNFICMEYSRDFACTGYESYGWTWNYADFIPQKKQNAYQGVCPDGWRIPTSEDWKTLLNNMAAQYGVDSDKAGVFLYDDVATGFGLKVTSLASESRDAYNEWDNSFVVADAPNYFAYFTINDFSSGLPLNKIKLYVYTTPAFPEPAFYTHAFVRCIKE